MSQSLQPPLFLRRTSLTTNEYRKNFQQIDADTLRVISSADADRISPKMAKIYLRLITAPTKYWESDGVLKFDAEHREGNWLTSSRVLAAQLEVSPTVASKALQWLHSQGVIGYVACKNGIGIRIFINRAAASIGLRVEKILSTHHSPSRTCHSPASELPFKVERSPDKNLDQEKESPSLALRRKAHSPAPLSNSAEHASQSDIDLTALEDRLTRAMNQRLETDQSRTRDWVMNSVLPKAIRVAQAETYKLLRKRGKGNLMLVGQPPSDNEPPPEFSPVTVQRAAVVAASIAYLHDRPVDSVVDELIKAGTIQDEQRQSVLSLAYATPEKKEALA